MSDDPIKFTSTPGLFVSMPLRMEIEPFRVPPVDFLIGSGFGGMDVYRPSALRIITDIGPAPRHYHTDSRRKRKRARCKASRRARLRRRHWVRRARRGERE